MSKKKKESKWAGRTGKNARKQKSEKGGFGYLNLPDGVELYKPTPGETEKIDIIPYEITDKKHPDIDAESGLVVGEQWYRRPFKVHSNIGANNDKYVCLTSFGEECPICKHRAMRAKDGASTDELKAFNTSNRNLYVVVPRDIKKVKETIHIFDFSQFNFQDLLNDELEENEDYEVFPDLEDGLTLKIRWSEEAFQKNKYAKANRIDFLERDEAIDMDELGDVPNLDKVLKKLSYKELEAKFLETDYSQGGDEDNDEEDEKPVKKSKKETKPPFDEDEDDEPVQKKTSGKSKAKKDEDEDEGEDDKPAKKEKKSKKTPEPEENDLSWDDLKDMDETELAEVIEEKDLDIDLEDYEDDEDGLREAIAEELEIEVVKEKPAKKDKKKLEPEKEESPKKKAGNSTKTTSPSKEQKCPVKGGKFGVSTDDYDECDECPLYDACEKANYN